MANSHSWTTTDKDRFYCTKCGLYVYKPKHVTEEEMLQQLEAEQLVCAIPNHLVES